MYNNAWPLLGHSIAQLKLSSRDYICGVYQHRCKVVIDLFYLHGHPFAAGFLKLLAYLQGFSEGTNGICWNGTRGENKRQTSTTVKEHDATLPREMRHPMVLMIVPIELNRVATC
jgi:hypothetical protein